MQALAWRSMDRFADCLDFFRSRILRLTLHVSWLRPFFYTRYRRLALLFTISFAVSLNLALFLPLWLLLFGPLVYGVPHIVASLRYFHHSAREASKETPRTRMTAFGMAGSILIAVCAYRLLQTHRLSSAFVPNLSEWKGSNFLDLLALGTTFVLGVLIYRKSLPQILRGIALIAPFGLVFWLNPAWTIGAMVLIHNFIAFAYWIRSTQTRQERAVAWSAFAILLLTTVAIFLGAFDPAYRFFQPVHALDLANLTVEDTGRLIAPWWSGQSSFWLHACVAYAFGQALHYFVWLKAIPDQVHYHDVPTSFRQSLALLSQDFGRWLAMALIFISAFAVVVWSFMSFHEARLIYFCLAAYHGYLEIAGLALSQGKSLNRPI